MLVTAVRYSVINQACGKFFSGLAARRSWFVLKFTGTTLQLLTKVRSIPAFTLDVGNRSIVEET